MKRNPVGRLRHQLFVWLALTILATLIVVSLVVAGMSPGEGTFVTRMRQAGAFAAQQVGERWHDAGARDEFVRDLHSAFGATVWLTDTNGRELVRVGTASCRGFRHSEDVMHRGQRVGQIQACFAGHRHVSALAAVSVLAAVCLVLWVAAALLARRVTRPLSLLIDTTRDIGAGNLAARVRLGRHGGGELGLLADSVNDMAQRIERQLREQRELLAAVSHEIRSPLSRLRVSSEILRENPRDLAALAALEREVEDLDVLVGKLLANSRLDFGMSQKQAMPAAQLWLDALERRGLSPALLHDASQGAIVEVDPTLIARALDNLIDNALRHAGNVEGCELQPDPDKHELTFAVRDSGAGFPDSLLARAFEAFQRGQAPDRAGSSSLGLGLALVQRIALAHGGRAWAENLPQGGARVAFSVARRAGPPARASQGSHQLRNGDAE